MRTAFTFLLLSAVNFTGFAQQIDTILYKTVDSTSLYMEIYHPTPEREDVAAPAIVFFFGGGWVGGTRGHFRDHAEYYAKKGFVCFLPDYRTRNVHGTTPFESLKDAKSAMRYIRSHAVEIGLDPSRIVGSGGSAGGHLAAATALVEGYNERTDDLTVNPKPDALVLFNPVIDNGPGGYGFERIGDRYTDFSPLHNITAGAPPTLLFLGTEDKLIPVSAVENYQAAMNKVGSRCELALFPGEGHGFFDIRHRKNYQRTLDLTDTFLRSLGYL